MDKTEESAVELLENRSSDGRIPCKQALRIAEETGLPARRIGALIDEKGIKLIECQLGCFGWKEKQPE